MIGPSAPEKGDCMKGLWLGATVAAVALLCVRPAAAQIGIVSVTGGRVEGVTADGVTSFKGIPFAAPPVGNLRWRAPHPVRAWSGIKKADHFAPSCMQDPMWAPILGSPPALSEDCLYLNVWTPARSARARLPIMVWVYGGGLTQGTTSAPVYEGTHLAGKGVVVVSVAYRLGALGFLADPELSGESPYHVSGNYGVLDLIAALRWVRTNITKFGGDPSRVTIFGESAGGSLVAVLAASPLAKGLFQRVLSESGVISGDGGPSIWSNMLAAETTGEHFLAKLGVRNITAARALSAEALVKALGERQILPVIDGHLLQGNLYELFQAHRFSDTPLLLGTNSDEGRMFVAPGATPARFEAQVRKQFGSDADAILALYPHTTNAEAEQATRDVERDSLLAWSAWAWANLYSRKDNDDVYLYYFDRYSPQAPLGPTHSAEIGYVFGNLVSTVKDAPFALSGPPGPADIALSKLIQSYWVNFARTGDPNGPALPHWPAFSSSSQRVMYLDAHPHAGPVPNLKKLKALDAYFAWLREEAKKKQAN